MILVPEFFFTELKKLKLFSYCVAECYFSTCLIAIKHHVLCPILWIHCLEAFMLSTIILYFIYPYKNLMRLELVTSLFIRPTLEMWKTKIKEVKGPPLPLCLVSIRYRHGSRFSFLEAKCFPTIQSLYYVLLCYIHYYCVIHYTTISSFFVPFFFPT